MVAVSDLAAWLNATYPTRDWDQQCARLVWNAVHYVSGTPEHEMISYDPAKAAYRASSIESQAPGNAPSGALHYFANPPVEGHVAVDVGDGLVLMTGTRAALGDDAYMLGTNYGLTTIASYMRARGNPYLGWSRSYGQNPSIVNQISLTTDAHPGQEEDEEMMKNIGMFRMNGGIYHVTIGNPVSGFKLKYTTGSSKYNGIKAEQFNTGNFTQEDQSVIDRFEEALDAVRQGK